MSKTLKTDKGEIEMQPIDIWEWLSFQFGGGMTQYPKRCGICGTPTRGNRFTGYKMGCNPHEAKA